MSYLRPTCSDAAVRVSNLGLSRHIPSVRQDDARNEQPANTTTLRLSEDAAPKERLPSQRPLDRRWDKSRGLFFGDRSYALKHRTWNPTRGIIFTSNVGQRRSYAMRPTRITPVAPKPPSSTPDASRVYGSGGMPSLERPTGPAAAVVPKGIKQEQMGRDLKEATAAIKAKDERIRGLEKENGTMKVQLIEDKASFEKDKERIYSRGLQEGLRDGRASAKAELQSEMQNYESRHEENQRKLEEAEKQFPTLKTQLLADIERRERSLEAQTKRLEQKKEKRYREANQFDAEVKRREKEIREDLEKREREVQLREDGIRNRKAQRPNYHAYRDLYHAVRDERVILDRIMKSIGIRLWQAREQSERDITQQEQSAEPMVAGTGESRLTPSQLKELDDNVRVFRDELNSVDKALVTAAHFSRVLTKRLRFEDTRRAAKSMSAVLYLAGIDPLKNVKTRTQEEIDDIEGQIQNASNATTREELKLQKNALYAEKGTVNSTMELTFLDRDIQMFQTLKWEPYVHKAVVMSTFDIFAKIHQATLTTKSPTNWALIRDESSKFSDLAKRTALIIEAMGRHKEHEKRLDVMIDQKVANLTNQLLAKRAQLFGNQRAARAAAKRAPVRNVRAWAAPSSSATSADTSLVTYRPLPEAQKKETKQKTHELTTAMRKLRISLQDDPGSMDPSTRADKVRQYTVMQIQCLDHAIRRYSQKLVSNPRKRSEIEANGRIAQHLETTTRRRDNARKSLETGTEPAKVRRRSATEWKPAETTQIPAISRSNETSSESIRDEASGPSEPLNQEATQGPKTPDDAVQHERLDHAVVKPEPKTRRARLMQLSKQAILEKSIREQKLQLKDIRGSLTSDQIKERAHHIYRLRLEALQTVFDNTRRNLESLGLRTTGNADQFDHYESHMEELRHAIDKRLAVIKPDESRQAEHASGGLDDAIGSRRSETATSVDLATANTLQHDSTRDRPKISIQKSQGEDTKSTLTSSDDQEQHEPASHGLPKTPQIPEENSLDNSTNASSPKIGDTVEQPTDGTNKAPRGLNLSPSPVRQAGRRGLHDSLLWAEFIRRQQVSAATSADHTVADEVAKISTEAARDDNDAKSPVNVVAASLSPEAGSHPTSCNNITETANAMADTDADFLPSYEISLEDKKNALIASRTSTASFWRYSLYKNAQGQLPSRHYCTSFEQTEAQIANFLGETVVGFDLEWEKFKSKPGEDSAKRCVSLVQIAAEGRVALFHLALFKGGDSTAELMPPALRAFLENPKIIKVGVNIGGDATRLRNCFGVEMQGNIELSHLYKLVTYGESNPAKVNRGLYSLANQVKEVLHLPLAKGAVRTSSWSKRLNNQQVEYAVSDAYAGLRLYYELERRRKAMESKPPRPAFHELGLPIMLGGDQVAPTKSRRGKRPEDQPEELIEETAALQEQDDGDASESSDDFFDAPEDLEAFDAYVESQDAEAMAGASLPEINYPTLPPLEDLSDSDFNSDIDDSSLPSDPLTAPSTSTRPPPAFHSPEAATADAWATAWQAQLSATYNMHVSQPQLRAYHLWHHQGFDPKEVAALLRKEPLALSTVVSYIAEALQKEDLEFDAERVREVRARLPASVRGRYAKLYAGAGGDGV